MDTIRIIYNIFNCFDISDCPIFLDNMIDVHNSRKRFELERQYIITSYARIFHGVEWRKMRCLIVRPSSESIKVTKCAG